MGMKSIFLCESEKNINRVYTPENVEWLKKNAGLLDGIYTKEKLAASPEILRDVKYVFSTWGMPVLTEEEIRRYLPKLEAVFYGAGSVQAFARPFLQCGVKVFSAWAANGVPVAEYTAAQIILANKGFFKVLNVGSREAYAAAKTRFQAYPGNYGAKIGIIGAGMIGKMVIKKLQENKLSVLVYDPFLSDEKAEAMGVEKTSLSRVFAECQVVSNHLANNEQTRGMLHYELFASMLSNATFLNTGRGAQVVEEDLVKVLRERPDITAILDVTYPEPPVEGHPFYELDNCILTPHMAGSNGDEVHRMADYMVEEFRLLTDGKPVHYEVTKEMLETMA